MAEDSASWYQRRLSQMRGQQQPARPYQQPVAPRQPVQGYQQGYQQNLAPPSPPAATPETLTELLELQRQGQALKPGKGARLNPDPCPHCGGNLFYADLGMKRRGPRPAPRCFNCGYNELFEQGLESNWQGGA